MASVRQADKKLKNGAVFVRIPRSKRSETVRCPSYKTNALSSGRIGSDFDFLLVTKALVALRRIPRPHEGANGTMVKLQSIRSRSQLSMKISIKGLATFKRAVRASKSSHRVAGAASPDIAASVVDFECVASVGGVNDDYDIVS
ncbi:hypothetical protein O1611_g1716 [Lasiodiplodia mahajangana]|uniref:Uncharacterized protein n=1 Tax=Lasiodiplodia mahajangana TaxID=1108764 RepID=A0ACC2JX73_9PEZI|nr:hypothetical protein O1611_g1716 [Lasiodiplodia mahajangana]